ncbi:glycoside hydrolase family 3 N-terminal domain-containing protein [Flavihumibacter sp. ZG627]|uniref:glycoside hydrolase family 3 protein n=1 Tax=Flavihumibacter sp. ZG627 TaxID=1463156 RepID=UPI00057F77DE|nr:glycoside hydrolase family 3 N-terminal domain-containing protein [Flavihumibacter sp. ZG627]KIC91726.1 beta-glucosidase [Flavihumibacter sp. ZG627]
MKPTIFFVVLALFASNVLSQQWTEVNKGNFRLITNKGGRILGYSPNSGIRIISKDGYAFKDLNRNGKLDIYEDWRNSFEARAKDLASKMTIEQIAGLMLYSGHQSIPARSRGFGSGTYNGKPISESDAKAYDLSDQQKQFLSKDNLRHVLITSVESPDVAARWNNNLQAMVEGLALGIPANTSSDPRHNAIASTEYNAGAGGKISMWPEALGLAATFDPKIVLQFGKIAAREYRALGITTALSPQIDLGTEPRWNRIKGTFGEDPYLSADMGRAYIDGFQTSEGVDELKDGWGFSSVNAMVKHWPSGGPEEGGRDAHFAYGKFAVYPGNNFELQMIPFLQGAFKLSGKTKMASAVMPYYTISFNQDKKYGENVGNGFSKYIITDLLRKKYGYEGVVCTDWLITADEGKTPDIFAGKSWGVERENLAQRHYKVLMAGVDQFGGNNASAPVIEAYQMGVKEHGETFMRNRFEQSAVRLLLNIFRTGIFENPYLDPENSKLTVGKAEYVTAGYQAQLKSIVMLKNRLNVLPLQKKKTVYIPKRLSPAMRDWFGNLTPEKLDYPVNMELVKKYFNVSDDPAVADFALVFVKSPMGGVGYEKDDREKGGSGYVPISLQYSPYTAVNAREKSIAAGDPLVDPSITDRTYKGKSFTALNHAELKSILDTRIAMADKPVIVSVEASGPMIFSEFESKVDGILLGFGVQDQAILDILTGVEPSGLLPVQMPADMKTVEEQFEDTPHDMNCHVDAQGNKYDFGFGLNWKGKISDKRTEKYKKRK